MTPLGQTCQHKGMPLFSPQRMERWNATAENYGITVVTDGVSKLIDGPRHTHLFQNFSDFQGIKLN